CCHSRMDTIAKFNWLILIGGIEQVFVKLNKFCLLFWISFGWRAFWLFIRKFVVMQPLGHARDGERYPVCLLDIGAYIFHLQICIGLQMAGYSFSLVCR